VRALCGDRRLQAAWTGRAGDFPMAAPEPLGVRQAVRVNDAVVNGLVAGGLGILGALAAVAVGWFLSSRQQHKQEARARREDMLAQMQALVSAVSALGSQRKAHDAIWLSGRSRVRVVGMSFLEFAAAFQRSSGEGGWSKVAAACGPAARVVHDWDRHTLESAGALMAPMARVAAAGLALGMVEDSAVAKAARALTDAALENKDEAVITAAVQELRWAFYPNERPSGS